MAVRPARTQMPSSPLAKQVSDDVDRLKKSPLCGTSHDARIWLTLDCCGLTTASVTWLLVLFSEMVVTKALLKRKPLGFAAQAGLFNLVSILAMISHARAMLSDPGAVPKGAEPLQRDSERAKAAAAAKAGFRMRAKGWCHRCGSYKPPRAHHDSVTGRCVVKLDHYCPWTNNAIGVRNHKFFLLFIFYVFLMCLYTLGFFLFLLCESLSADANTKFDRRRHKKYRDDELPAVNAANCAVAFFAVLFGLFTLCMLCDQWTVLTTNVAKIDRLKGDEDDLNIVSGVNEVFGGRGKIHLDWVLPILPRFPASVHDDIMGFRCSNSGAGGSLGGDVEGGGLDAFSDHGDDDLDSKELLLGDHRYNEGGLGDADSSLSTPTGAAAAASSGIQNQDSAVGPLQTTNQLLITSDQGNPPLAKRAALPSGGEASIASSGGNAIIIGASSSGTASARDRDRDANGPAAEPNTTCPPQAGASGSANSILGRLGGVFSDKDTRHTV